MPRSSSHSPRRRRSLARLLVVCASVASVGACARDLPPVPYVAPPPGTVYDYGTFSNTVTRSAGWRTTYVDDRGREGRRVALFITEDPKRPLEVPGPALDSLWPLRLGRQLTLRTRQDQEVYRWEFRVLDTTTVTVGAGTFHTVVVEGVNTPELVRDPNSASTVLHTWWFAPEANAVVRFESNYLGGPATGRRVAGELREIRSPSPGDSGRPAAPPTPDSGAGRPAAPSTGAAAAR
jgi:hypothetical protein